MTDPINRLLASDNDSPTRDFVHLADQANALNKAAVFDALAEAGVHTLTVSFDGYGDSGQIESVDAVDAANAPVELPAQRPIQVLAPQENELRLQPEHKSLQEAIETLVYEYLEATHMGWENGDGAYGTFVFTVPERTVTLEHSERFVDATTTTHTF